MKRTIQSLEAMHAYAQSFVKNLTPQQEMATVIALSGNLGSGKTTFTQGIAKVLGVTDCVTSPTFVIQKSYTTAHPHFTKLIHIDAYRLENADELSVLGFDELLTDTHNLILIEWAEQVHAILPKDIYALNFRFIDDATRKVEDASQ